MKNSLSVLMICHHKRSKAFALPHAMASSFVDGILWKVFVWECVGHNLNTELCSVTFLSCRIGLNEWRQKLGELQYLWTVS